MTREVFNNSLSELKNDIDQVDQWIFGPHFNVWKERIVSNLAVLNKHCQPSHMPFLIKINNAWTSFCGKIDINQKYDVESLKNLKREIKNLCLHTNKEEDDEEVERYFQRNDQCSAESVILVTVAAIALLTVFI